MREESAEEESEEEEEAEEEEEKGRKRKRRSRRNRIGKTATRFVCLFVPHSIFDYQSFLSFSFHLLGFPPLFLVSNSLC